jgi:hypothetical protein
LIIAVDAGPRLRPPRQISILKLSLNDKFGLMSHSDAPAFAAREQDPTPSFDQEALRDALSRRFPQLLAEVAELLEPEWPDYAAFLRQRRADVAGAGPSFIQWLLEVARIDRLGSQDARLSSSGMAHDSDALFESIGRLQAQQGQDLTMLLTAYQVGARVAWRYVSQTALSLEMEPDVVAALAEAVFVFVGRLSSSSAYGYAQQQSEDHLARERLRDELTQLLVSGRSDMLALRNAAARAGWRLPTEASIVLVDPEDETARRAVGHGGPQWLRLQQDGLFGAIIPDTAGPGHRSRLEESLSGAGAVVGPAVPLTLLPASARIAMIAERLTREGLLEGDPVFVSDHLDTIIVHRDDLLIKALRSQALAPLNGLTAPARSRLLTTLASWLRHQGNQQAVAAELGIHPQTVRYRLGQLRESFGTALDDPTERSRLFLAVVWGAPQDS